MNQEQQQPTYIDMDAGKSLISTGKFMICNK